MNSIQICFVVALSVFHTTFACKGCLNLDEFNFDKILPRFEAVLVKFDVAYPYGEKHDLFGKLSSEIVNNKNFILATVGIKDYGEKDNADLGKKYGVNSKDDLPALRLFVKGEDEPFNFDKNNVWNEENLKKFVREHTNIYLGLPGCLEEFDKIAMGFTSSNDKEGILKETEDKIQKLNVQQFDKIAMRFTSSNDKKGILKETEDKIQKLNVQREKDIASTYVKFMKKIIETGANFVQQETARLEKILKEGKVNEKKKEELSQRANVLKSFAIKKDKVEL